MSQALDLVKAVLGEDCTDDAKALRVLEHALEREVDVLLHCAFEMGCSPVLVMERAAQWAGYGFYHHVPPSLRGTAAPTRLEALAEVRMFRVQLLDLEIAFVAPGFLDVIRLRNQLATTPGLRYRLCFVPEQALRTFLTTSAEDALVDGARQTLARRWPFATAQLELGFGARLRFALGMLLLVLLLVIAPLVAPLLVLPVALLLLVGPAVIRLAAIAAPHAVPERPERPPDEELPIYSVLIPLHHEMSMVPQLFSVMDALDYPPDRLDIKFVVEARSDKTVAAIRARLGDPRYSLVVVPDALPRTKPKALNFALPLCRGEHVVVFDAEDIPDVDQLWKAALRFRDDPELVCLQARLVVHNGSQTWLSALFAGEYAGLFSVLLPALAQWRLPMPLGGTSNHFRLSALRQLGGWDAFNVTEDADLGVRLARRRNRVEVLDSATREAAPTQLRPWMGQRTRWMKGWMQTFIVHNRNPLQLLKELGPPAFLAFEMLALGMILAPILHCGFALVMAIRWGIGTASAEGSAWSAFYLAVLALGYGSAFTMMTLGLRRAGQTGLLAGQIMLPFYWLLMGVATVRAGLELVTRPFYWFKSPHQPVTVVRRRGEDGQSTNQHLVT